LPHGAGRFANRPYEWVGGGFFIARNAVLWEVFRSGWGILSDVLALSLTAVAGRHGADRVAGSQVAGCRFGSAKKRGPQREGGGIEFDPAALAFVQLGT